MIDRSNPISGVGFSAVKVASFDDSSCSWIYKWEEPYAGVGISPNNLATDDIRKIYPYLIDVEKRNGLSASPALVGLPSYEEQSGLLYDVTVCLKTQVRTESGSTSPYSVISAAMVTSGTSLSTKPGNVRTDDESDIYVPIALIAISLLAIFIDMVDMDCLTDKDHSVLNLKEYKERLLF